MCLLMITVHFEKTNLQTDGWTDMMRVWRWISGIVEVGLTDIHTDIHTYGRTDPLIEMRGRI